MLAGGGCSGGELMENLRELGIDVTVVQRPRQLLTPLAADMAAFLHAKLRQKGVRLHLGCTVEGFAATGARVNVLLKDEAPLTADMVVLAIGITLTAWLLLRAGGTPPTLVSVRIGILVAGAAAIITVIERRKRRK